MSILALVAGRLDAFWTNGGYGVNHATWDDLVHWPAAGGATGNYVDLGGVFTSPPIAASMNSSRVDVFGLGTDYALYHRFFNGTTWSSGWENLGGDLTSPPAVIAQPNRLDVFALAADHSMTQRSWTPTGWSDWTALGGCFTTVPVALAGPGGRIDLFSRGPDGMIYKSAFTSNAWTDWTLLGGPLLAQPIAASAPSAVRWGTDNLNVFVVGFDGALWNIAWDGVRWHPWESIGGKFTSEPIAFASNISDIVVGPGPGNPNDHTPAESALIGLPSHNRFDIFVVGPSQSDSTQPSLWQVTKDKSGWVLTSWDLGPLLGLPAIIRAQGLAAVGPAPRFMAIAPNLSLRISEYVLADSGPEVYSTGPDFRTTNTYRFSIDKVSIDQTRALHNDTDHIAASVGVERWPNFSLTYEMGDVNSGNYPLTAAKIAPFAVELCERMVASYMIVNSGDDSKAPFVVSTAAKGLEDWINDLLKGTNILKDDIFAAASLSGSLLGALAAVGIETALSIAFGGSDGVVAVGSQPFSGRALQQALGAGGAVSIQTPFYGSDLPTIFSMPSYYTVNWSITRY
jgi:hypothetical protein